MHFIKAAAQVLFGNIPELEARQCGHGFPQGTQEELSLQAVAVGGCTVEVITRDIERNRILRGYRRFLPGNIERHALWHKVFDVEIPHLMLAVTRTGANMPHPGLRAALKRVVKAVKTVCGLADHRARHLPVRA